MSIHDIWDELKKVLRGRTLDAALPPLIFLISNRVAGIIAAISVSIVIAVFLGVYRYYKSQKWQYAFGGLTGVIIAAGFALLTKNANNYFITAAIRSGVIFATAFITVIFKKPMAAWASHLSRGWPLEWYWRNDIRPAYTEISVFWGILFFVRMIVQIYFLIEGDTESIVWANFVLGWPFTVSILILTYIYGIWRLKNLKGPGVDEFIQGKQRPWEGQKKGF